MSQVPPTAPEPAEDAVEEEPASVFSFAGIMKSALNGMEANEQLRKLGYNFTFENNGVQRIILADYPGRPQIELFRNTDQFLTPPVGAIVQFLSSAHAHIRNNMTRYTLNLPASLGDSIVADIEPIYQLIDLELRALAFNEDHGVKYTVPQIIQMHHALDGDIEKILEALALGLPGKQVADMLNMGYTYEEIVQLKNVPVSLIFDGAPDRSRL